MDYKVFIAIFDFVPCIIYFIAMLKVQKLLYSHMSKYSFAMLAAGSFMVLTSGILKALWKLFFYSSNGAIDLFKLNHQFLPINALGFGFAFASLIIMIIDFKLKKKKDVKLNSFAPLLVLPLLAELPKYLGEGIDEKASFIYIIILALGTVGFLVILSIIAFKKKKKASGFIFIVACLFMLCMGYLAAQDFGGNIFANLTAELVNTSGQLFFLSAVMMLEKVGVDDIETLLA